MKTADLILLPYPKKLKIQKGIFLFSPEKDHSLAFVVQQTSLLPVEMISQEIEKISGIRPRWICDSSPSTSIYLGLTSGIHQNHPEAYTIEIQGSGVKILGNTSRGIFYGAQTLCQLLSQYGLRLPHLKIED